MQPWQEKLAEYGRSPGFLLALSKSAEAMCAPFWWSLQKQPGERAQILNNGSVCYFSTGAREVGVTANHVLEKYLEHLAEHGDAAVECQFGGSTISPEKRIVEQSKFWDLAAIDVPEVFVTAAKLSPRMQHKPLTWPPARAQEGEVVLYGGFPGILRADKVRTADFPFQWVAGGVSDTSQQLFVLEPGFETLHWIQPEPGQEFNRDFGGMSGGPVFRVLDTPIVRLELVGFIYEFVGNADNPSAGGHAVLARHADTVLSSGEFVQA